MLEKHVGGPLMSGVSRNFDILCAGSIVQDTIIRPVDVPRWGTTTFVDAMDRYVGGNGANTASALAVLGNRVRLLGAIGIDESAQFVRAHLDRLHVDTGELTLSSKPNAATTVLVNSAGDRQFLHRLGSSHDAFCDPMEFTESLIGGSRHFHLASFFVLPKLRVNAPEVLRRARAAGLSTSLDVNWDASGEWLHALAPALPYVDIFFVNEDESRMLSGTSDRSEAAKRFHSCGARRVVQKLGGHGCAIFTAGEASPLYCEPYDVACIDTTGAGDCFAAGFLTALLRGAPLQECGEWGNAAGALSVSRMGAVTGLHSRTQFESWLLQHQSAGLPASDAHTSLLISIPRK